MQSMYYIVGHLLVNVEYIIICRQSHHTDGHSFLVWVWRIIDRVLHTKGE